MNPAHKRIYNHTELHTLWGAYLTLYPNATVTVNGDFVGVDNPADYNYIYGKLINGITSTALYNDKGQAIKPYIGQTVLMVFRPNVQNHSAYCITWEL